MKRARTRNGCLNCKTKKRKCDEIKPVCSRCSNKSEDCEWASRLTFRAENALSLGNVHKASHERRSVTWKPAKFKIKDVTAEIIRDCQQYELTDDGSSPLDTHSLTSTSPITGDSQKLMVGPNNLWQTGNMLVGIAKLGRNEELRSTSAPRVTADIPTSMPTAIEVGAVRRRPFATGFSDDSVFLPGSAYLDAHSMFRDHLIEEVRSNIITREATPNACHSQATRISDGDTTREKTYGTQTMQSWVDTSSELSESAQVSSFQLSEEEEFCLWKNWSDEVAPWLDKFDSERHFQHTLPILARSNKHLRYSILAVSARQLERKQQNKHTERSLSLYQEAIQLILPALHTRSTPVIASCVVLCVLEMLSSSPKAWHQHLDGCANLIQALGINGFSGGVDQALFWCFARMDFCGGLIASSRTLMPIDRWIAGVDLDGDIHMFQKNAGFNSHACQAVYLCAQILDLLAFCPHLGERVGASPSLTTEVSNSYTDRWEKLWRYITQWAVTRPAEMLPIACINASSKPFPMVLYSNAAAISGNQLYHTASILMLRHKPPQHEVKPKPRSIFWHARQICAIAMSNDNHGAWTNSVQPLWIAGQWMSHKSEQQAILEILARIEKETGWGTKWRIEDLQEFWG
ncbi:hypothetical protein ACN47E_003835 [Coniothyrium glycines]